MKKSIYIWAHESSSSLGSFQLQLMAIDQQDNLAADNSFFSLFLSQQELDEWLRTGFNF